MRFFNDDVAHISTHLWKGTKAFFTSHHIPWHHRKCVHIWCHAVCCHNQHRELIYGNVNETHYCTTDEVPTVGDFEVFALWKSYRATSQQRHTSSTAHKTIEIKNVLY